MGNPKLALGQPLSPRQVEILEHICQGGRRNDMPNPIGQGTWGTQVARLRIRLGAKTLTQAAVLYALKKEAALKRLEKQCAAAGVKGPDFLAPT